MRVDRLDKWLRGTITVLIVGVYVGKVFYDLNGNYSFLTEFDYYFTTISTTSLALFLRWLYSDTGLEVELNKNDKIKAKETLKAELIQEVNDLDLVDVLELAIIAKNKVNKLKEYKIDFIVLAGSMIKIPENILKIYANKIINIHPALLPKYGGKGMYGLNVHKAVINAKETETGITIHIVDDNYDKGKIIFQAK